MKKPLDPDEITGVRSPKSKLVFWKWLYINWPVYLKRLRLFECDAFGFYIHWMNGPDIDRDLHDHPFDFTSFIVFGSYEEVSGEPQWVSPSVHMRPIVRFRWLNRKIATTPHKIIKLYKRKIFGYELPVITFVVRGKRRRDWGFHTPTGWVFWKIYLGDVELTDEEKLLYARR